MIVAVCAAGATFSARRSPKSPGPGAGPGGGRRRPIAPQACGGPNCFPRSQSSGRRRHHRRRPVDRDRPALGGPGGPPRRGPEGRPGPGRDFGGLLSIDALKTCVVSDALTGERHDADRVLTGQGLANVVSAVVGGSAGSGTMGPTLINLTSGARPGARRFLVGGFSLTALLVGGPILGPSSLAALAGLLVAVACCMADRESLRLLKDPSTRFDFGVVAAVVATAVGKGLIEAAAVGRLVDPPVYSRAGQELRRSGARPPWPSAAPLRARSPEASALLGNSGRLRAHRGASGAAFSVPPTSSWRDSPPIFRSQIRGPRSAARALLDLTAAPDFVPGLPRCRPRAAAAPAQPRPHQPPPTAAIWRLHLGHLGVGARAAPR